MNDYQPVMTQDEVVALLGRPRSEEEAKKFNIYFEIDDLKLKQLL